MIKSASLVAIVVSGALIAAQPAGQQRPVNTTVDRGWPLIGGDLTNARYSLLEEINADTVKSLGAVWTSAEFDENAQSRATPVVSNGLMFVTAGAWVYALDAATGTTRWKARPDERPLPENTSLMNPRAQADALKTDRRLPTASGVAVGGGLVFVGLTGGEVIALEESTGKFIWSRQIGDDPPPKGQAVSAVPVYWGETLFAGLANGDFGLRGRIVALDARTGRERWRFFTVPGPGERGHETWQQDNDAWKRGGGGVWLTGAVDPDLGLVYFATGNPVPMTGGEIRGGDNLYTASVVALDVKTGTLMWHFQTIHHDIWDADVAVAPVLYDVSVNGQLRKGIGALRSDGDLFLLDRATGKPLVPIEERPVPQDRFAKTAATQPFSIGAQSFLPTCDEWRKVVTAPPGFAIDCQYSPVSFNSNIVAPGFAVRVAPMSFSRQTGYFYAAGAAALGPRRRISPDPYFVQIGGRQPPGLNRTFAALAAIDSRTNRVVWKKEIPAAAVGRSGTLATAGGLVMRSGGDGNVEAYSAASGDRLWQFQVGVQGGGGPLASYVAGGRQYVALAAGRRVWAFALGGSLSPVQPPAGRGGRGGPPLAADNFVGPIEDTSEIETASMLVDMGINGRRYAIDEHAFNPYRARVKAGTRVTWINNGTIRHSIRAQDGSWSLGVLSPAEVRGRVFDKPGSYVFVCEDHPWAVGQLIVQ